MADAEARGLMEPTPLAQLYQQCRYYGIKHAADSLWLEEFTWGSGRFDLLTLDLSTWLLRGFEMKVDRADFLGDKKWQHYLPYVNDFYFATVPGVIQPAELPAEIGLLELVDGELVVRKRAKRLQPTFVRHTYGELFVTRLMLNVLRACSWREAKDGRCCVKCGQPVSFRDPRMRKAGTGMSQQDPRLSGDQIG